MTNKRYQTIEEAFENVPELRSRKALKDYLFSIDLTERTRVIVSNKLNVDRLVLQHFIVKYNLKPYFISFTSNLDMRRSNRMNTILKYIVNLEKRIGYRYNVHVTDSKEKRHRLSIVLLSLSVVIQTEKNLPTEINDVKHVLHVNDKDFDNIVTLSKLKLKLCKTLDIKFPIYEHKVDNNINPLEYIELAKKLPEDKFRSYLYMNWLTKFELESKKNITKICDIKRWDNKLIIQNVFHYAQESATTENNIKNLSNRLGRL